MKKHYLAIENAFCLKKRKCLKNIQNIYKVKFKFIIRYFKNAKICWEKLNWKKWNRKKNCGHQWNFIPHTKGTPGFLGNVHITFCILKQFIKNIKVEMMTEFFHSTFLTFNTNDFREIGNLKMTMILFPFLQSLKINKKKFQK